MNCAEDQIKTRTCSLVPFGNFLADLGKSSVTGWRWRRAEFVKTLNISGKVYISRDEIQRFEQRAAAGEFAKAAHVPRRAKGSAI